MYINFSEDDLYRANSADLASYLERRGERVQKVGSTYKYIYTDGSGTHDSVTIHGGKWFDHKKQKIENAVGQRTEQNETSEEISSDEPFQISMSV